MNDEQKSIAASQWNIPATVEIKEEPPPQSSAAAPEAEPPQIKSTGTNTFRQRGFFEAISCNGSYQQKLENLLHSYEAQARNKIEQLQEYFDEKIKNLKNRKSLAQANIEELKLKIAAAEKYNEKEDPQLQQLLDEKVKQEEELAQIRKQISDLRVRLGEAKAGIINKSLDEAEIQVRKALGIQNLVYEQTRSANRNKYEDEKDYLQRLSKSYQELLVYYTERYQRVNRYLKILDVDGISPVTATTLTTIGTISFGAAGFFFSTFAGNAGFGNQDMLYYILDGLIRTARQPFSGTAKLLMLFSVVAAITLISWLCDFLIRRLNRKHDDEILSKLSLGTRASNKIDLLEYQLSLKSNNWYAFWLQIIPGLFIAGMIILSLSLNYKSSELNKINASSEGLIIGTSIAISLAGLIYLYITKIVEPRLLKRYDAHPGERINWIKANSELVAVLVIFVMFSICVIMIPLGTKMSTDYQVRYALLLFIAICLVGSMSFAYGIRNKGLLQTSRYLERVIKWLNRVISYCSSPEAPEINYKLAPEHSNILEHVLKQLSWKAAVNTGDGRVQRKPKAAGFFGPLMDALKRSKKEEERTAPENSTAIIEPWEARYFPHIVEELKAKEFECRVRLTSVQYAQDNITAYKSQRTNLVHMQVNEIDSSRNTIKQYETEIETLLETRIEQIQKANHEKDSMIADLQDGFYLGMLYKENGVAPKIDMAIYQTPVGLISSQ